MAKQIIEAVIEITLLIAVGVVIQSKFAVYPVDVDQTSVAQTQVITKVEMVPVYVPITNEQSECMPTVITKTIVKTLTIEPAPQAEFVPQVQIVSVVKNEAPKNMVGFGIGHSKTETETSVNGLTVSMKRSYEQVLSADYTRFVTNDIGIYGQIQTNSSILMGVRYAF
ncbi:hypothetical protein [Bdellovibrio sp. HCB209]|uniref:hypothetical protein n=1 Tax=Bdellovibrio sp. HCB209 TaxID=3394354 RepID=UPI0039B3DB31